MINVLITGSNSYLGENTKNYLEQFDNFCVDVLDMRDENWSLYDFSKFQIVLNVCAIVHRPDIKECSLYEKVNCDLAVKIAEKAKTEGVKQFIQISTNGVFGLEVGEMSEKGGYLPKTPYEISKLHADIKLSNLKSENFKICIIRPPLIYGVGCKGNYPSMEKFAIKTLIFPKYKNKRDFIYIKNLCDFIKFAIENELNQICYPRNSNPICVSLMVKTIAQKNNHKIWMVHIFNPFIWIFMKLSRKLRLIFGSNYCIDPIANGFSWEAPFSFDDSMNDMYGDKNE